MMKYHLQFAGFLFLILSFSFLLLIFNSKSSSANLEAQNYDDCIKMPGSVVREIYPPQCVTSKGRVFTFEETESVTEDKRLRCNKIGGSFAPSVSECLGVDKARCESIDGMFNECASPCRNDPNAEVCTLMCETVCKLN